MSKSGNLIDFTQNHQSSPATGSKSYRIKMHRIFSCMRRWIIQAICRRQDAMSVADVKRLFPVHFIAGVVCPSVRPSFLPSWWHVGGCSTTDTIKKERKGIYIAPFVCYVYLKACLPFLRKRSPDGATPDWGRRHSIAAYYSTIDPEGIKKLGWPGLLTYSGRFTHKWSPVSYRFRAEQGKFAGQRPTFYHCVTQPTVMLTSWPHSNAISSKRPSIHS